MKTFRQLIEEALTEVEEVFPWDVETMQQQQQDFLLLDIREPYEFAEARIRGSLNVPRGVLEAACEYEYDESLPELIAARNREIVVICRSGNRSVLAAYTMQLLGFQSVKSLKTGVRGWNDYELPLLDAQDNLLDPDVAEEILKAKPVPAPKA